jgi:hypothetical protein
MGVEALEFNAEQVEMMRSEITDDEFMEWVRKHPGIYHIQRPINLTTWSGTLTGITFKWDGDD